MLPALVCGAGSMCTRNGAAFNPAAADGSGARHSGAVSSQGKVVQSVQERKEEEGWMDGADREVGLMYLV